MMPKFHHRVNAGRPTGGVGRLASGVGRHQRLRQIGDEVVPMLDAHRQAQQVGRRPLGRGQAECPVGAGHQATGEGAALLVEAIEQSDRRNRSAGAGVPAPSTLARCSIRLSVPPSEVARFQTCVFAATATAAASPPRARMDSMPPKPPFIWRRAISWPGLDGSPGYSTSAPSGWP